MEFLVRDSEAAKDKLLKAGYQIIRWESKGEVVTCAALSGLHLTYMRSQKHYKNEQISPRTFLECLRRRDV
jgi:hypothetical protein